MRAPAAAFAWEFRQHHRWGFVAIVAAMLILGGIKFAAHTTQALRDVHDVTFALLVPIPLSAGFFYLLAVFTFGVSGDLAARESMYPQRMFTLPVSSAALAGWPMLYGCLAMVMLWSAIRVAGVFPSGLDVPKYWPALFGASLLAWTQALTWMPYPLRGMRIVVAIVLLVSIDVVAFTVLETKPSESTMLLLLAPLVPVAYATARGAVARARRGDTPDWGGARRLAPARVGRGPDFNTPERAQLWFEWRQHGRSLPLLVAVVLPVGLSLLFLFPDVPVIVTEIVVGSLLLPPFLAVFVAATGGKSSSNTSESYGISPFLATRPAADRALVVAKWHAALLSTLAAWTIVAIAVPGALLLADATEPILDIVRGVDDALGRPRAITLGLLVIAALVGSTWKQLVQGFYLAMSGRDWAVKAITFATLALLTIGAFGLVWVFQSRDRVALAWSAIPWLMGALAMLKMLLAMVVMHRGVERGVYTRRQLVLGALAWDAVVLALYGVLALLLPAIIVRRHFLLLVAILVVPFVRLAAAPLAVAGNRHR